MSALDQLADERLAALVAQGNASAFDALHRRHRPALLALCRRLVGDDGEDAVQETLLRAHRALVAGRVPRAVRPWLLAIARNRCLTMLAARPGVEVAEAAETGVDALHGAVDRRANLRELVSGLARLPDAQRGAIVLTELGGLSHAEAASAIGCPPAKVKALVFQARAALIADRDARQTPCHEIRGVLDTGRGGALRRRTLRRHLSACDPCAAYRMRPTPAAAAGSSSAT
jgi:RNA polymerase sigma factor (sigma-70 family)